MSNNIFMFTGEEVYLLEQELQRRIDAFAQKHGQDAVRIFDADNFNPAHIQDALFAGGLFVSKTLVIIKGLPQDTSRSIAASDAQKVQDMLLQANFQIPETALLVLVSSKPDKRTSFYKKIMDVAQVKPFDPLKGVALKAFVQEQLCGLQVDVPTVEYFLLQVGSDLFRVVHECDKIRLRCAQIQQTQVTVSLIDMIVFGQIEANIFTFFDHVFVDPGKASAVLDTIRDEGAEWIQCAGALYRGLKSYLFTLDYVNHGVRDAKVIAQQAKLPPFTVAKNLSQLKIIQDHEQSVKKLYIGLVDTDIAIKDGKLPDVAFWPCMKRLVYDIHS